MCPQEFHPIWFRREKSRRESKAGEEGVNQDCENHNQGILPAMENAMEIREDMEEACVLTNLTCTALAPSKISSTNFSRDWVINLSLNSTNRGIRRDRLSHGVHSLLLGVRRIIRLDWLSGKSSFWLLFITIYTYSPLLLTWCVLFDLFWLLRAERILSLAGIFERVRTRFVHKKYAYNCNLKLE